MSLVLDTGIVVALYDAADPDHEATARWASSLDEDLVTTPMALAEMDYLVTKRGGEAGRSSLWRDVDVGAYTVRWWADGVRDTLEVARRHPFAGLTDASLVALAGILRTNRVATFDEHFRAMTPARGDHFVLLPQDA